MPIPAKTVRVGLGERAYDVVIGPGLLDEAGARQAPLMPRRRTAVVVDAAVAALHGARLRTSLEGAGIKVDMIEVPSGEASKSFDGLASLLDQLLALELDRGDLVTAFGGGVVGDLAGFAAAVYKRGIDFVQIPTTLLSQVDSSVGGKTAIDTPRGKNLVGAFHQPRLVLADLDVLATLPEREMRAGFAEVIKYGLLGDEAFFNWLARFGPDIIDREPCVTLDAVARSVEMKAEIVAEDEREAGRRALLNLGHTFGHALEAEVGWEDGALLHGEAVAVGCALAFRFSARLGLCSHEDALLAGVAIDASGLPARIADVAGGPFSADRLIAHMTQDKKAVSGTITLVLARAIGDAFVARDVDRAELRAFLIEEGCVAYSA
jgi:3-dehydroquinate synthase